MKLKFFKYQATGNDFVMIDGFAQDITLSKEQVRFLCDRHFGIGSDGLIILRPQKDVDFFMDFYNPDGSLAGFCGNGGRCSVKMASDLGIIDGKETVFKARDGVHDAYLVGREQARLRLRDVCQVKDYGQEIYVNTGTHHVVVFRDDVERIDDISAEARLIRYADRYKPDGTNVNFVQILSDSKIKVRTYEKGVEAETLSCGTGVVASALVSAWRYGFGSPVSVRARGGDLQVYFDRQQGCFTSVYLEGSAHKVFVGEIEI